MAGFYDLGLELLTTFGFDCVASKYDNTSFDINTGEYVKIISAASNCKAVLIQLDSGQLKESGYIYFNGDLKILLSAPQDFKITVDTIISFQEKDYKIAFISEVKDVLETALYKLVIRE